MSDGTNNNFLDSFDTQFIENLDSVNDAANDVFDIEKADAAPEVAPEAATDTTLDDDEPLFEIIHQPDAAPLTFGTPVYQQPQVDYAPVIETQPVVEPEAVADEVQPAPEADADEVLPETEAVADDVYVETSVASEEIAVPDESAVAEETVAQEEFAENNVPATDSVGKKAGRIIVSILLGITVAIFVFGCYTAAFLDKNAVYVFGHSFASVRTDNDAYGLSKGDLLIVKRTEPSEYAEKDLIVTRADALSAEYLQRVESVGTDSFTGEARITATSNFMGVRQTHELSPDSIVGVCNFYVPVFAGVINFAVANWIYVYILFALLMSFWILLLVLFKKKKN